MLRILRRAAATAAARSSRALPVVCLLGLAVWSVPASRPPTVQRASSRSVEHAGRPEPPPGDPAQALITFSYLVQQFAGYYFGAPPLALPAPLARQRDAMAAALSLLRCDITTRLAMGYEAVILPPSLKGYWVRFPMPLRQKDGYQDWLLVTRAAGKSDKKALVVLSTQGPPDTTVFWLSAGKGGYSADLIYDTFKKWRIVNLPHIGMGAASAAKLVGSETLLLREAAHPISGVEGGDVYRLDLRTREMCLASSVTPISALPPCKR